jgi:hypothetical protein
MPLADVVVDRSAVQHIDLELTKAGALHVQAFLLWLTITSRL